MIEPLITVWVTYSGWDKNGCHFPDDFLKHIFLNESVQINSFAMNMSENYPNFMHFQYDSLYEGIFCINP